MTPPASACTNRYQARPTQLRLTQHINFVIGWSTKAKPSCQGARESLPLVLTPPSFAPPFLRFRPNPSGALLAAVGAACPRPWQAPALQALALYLQQECLLHALNHLQVLLLHSLGRGSTAGERRLTCVQSCSLPGPARADEAHSFHSYQLQQMTSGAGRTRASQRWTPIPERPPAPHMSMQPAPQPQEADCTLSSPATLPLCC